MVPKKTSRPIRMLCRPFPHRKLPFSSILGGVLNPNANRPTLDLPPKLFQRKKNMILKFWYETFGFYSRLVFQEKQKLNTGL